MLFHTLRKPRGSAGAEAQREEGAVRPSGERGEDAHDQDEDEDAKQIVLPLWKCEVDEGGGGG